MLLKRWVFPLSLSRVFGLAVSNGLLLYEKVVVT